MKFKTTDVTQMLLLPLQKVTVSQILAKPVNLGA